MSNKEFRRAKRKARQKAEEAYKRTPDKCPQCGKILKMPFAHYNGCY